MSNLKNLTIRAFGQTDIGRVRATNDDSFLVNAERRIYAVADGLGGLPEGAVASQAAVDILVEIIDQSSKHVPIDFAEAFAIINQRVLELGIEIDPNLGIGTTLTAVQLWNDVLRIAHIGDTAVLLFRGEACEQLTRDHTMGQDMLDKLRPGETAFIPEHFHHTLTKCVGQIPQVGSDLFEHPFVAGDRILLASDGLTKTLEMSEIQHCLSLTGNPQTLVEELIRKANYCGGPDNITLIAVFVEPNEDALD